MLIYIIMTSFGTSNQGPFSINYLGSNHLIYCNVEATVIHLFSKMQKLGLVMKIGLGMETDAGKHNPFSIF